MLRDTLAPLIRLQSIRELSTQTGIPRYSLHRFLSGGGLNLKSIEALLTYFNLRVVPEKQVGRPPRGNIL